VARLERALNPAAGPLQEFAFQLRKVRAGAGNPTYRALARNAGYSATTLSEAARGVRKPTLDVVLAYVGACRGDVDEWRERWSKMDAALGADEGRSSLEPVREAPAEPVRQDGPAPRWWPRRRTVLALAAAALLVAVAAAVVWRPGGRTHRTATEPVCPRLPATRAFTGETYGSGAPIRTGASPDDALVSTVPSHCTLGFTGFCLGAKMRDATSKTPDIRWFILTDGTVVPSAVIHGNPPAKLRPSLCRNARPGPGAISLEVAADSAKPGAILARASGQNVDIVGFAARQATGQTGWRQIGLSEGALFRATWQPARPTGPLSAITVVAVACLGGGSPTDVTDVRALPSGRPSLSTQELAAAARSACQYPRS